MQISIKKSDDVKWLNMTKTKIMLFLDQWSHKQKINFKCSQDRISEAIPLYVLAYLYIFDETYVF